LHRLNFAVPSGTKIVILGKEAAYDNNRNNSLASQQRGDADMNAIETKLKSRGITVIPANMSVVLHNPAFKYDYIHLNAAGHKELATRLLPLVISALGGPSPGG
jgi:lysophospholipase L1-like esterase